jgi:hypothetical protein
MFETLDESVRGSGTDPGTPENSLEQDEPRGFEGPSTLIFWAAGVLILISFFMASSGSLRVFTAVTYMAVAVFATGVFWRLRKHVWFWTTLGLLLAFHLPLVIYVPFSQWWSHQKGMALVDLVDLLIYCACIAAIENLSKYWNSSMGVKGK